MLLGSTLLADVDGFFGFGCGVVVWHQVLAFFAFRFRSDEDLVAALAVELHVWVNGRRKVGFVAIAASSETV